MKKNNAKDGNGSSGNSRKTKKNARDEEQEVKGRRRPGSKKVDFSMMFDSEDDDGEQEDEQQDYEHRHVDEWHDGDHDDDQHQHQQEEFARDDEDVDQHDAALAQLDYLDDCDADHHDYSDHHHDDSASDDVHHHDDDQDDDDDDQDDLDEVDDVVDDHTCRIWPTTVNQDARLVAMRKMLDSIAWRPCGKCGSVILQVTQKNPFDKRFDPSESNVTRRQPLCCSNNRAHVLSPAEWPVDLAVDTEYHDFVQEIRTNPLLVDSHRVNSAVAMAKLAVDCAVWNNDAGRQTTSQLAGLDEHYLSGFDSTHRGKNLTLGGRTYVHFGETKPNGVPWGPHQYYTHMSHGDLSGAASVAAPSPNSQTSHPNPHVAASKAAIQDIALRLRRYFVKAHPVARFLFADADTSSQSSTESNYQLVLHRNDERPKGHEQAIVATCEIPVFPNVKYILNRLQPTGPPQGASGNSQGGLLRSSIINPHEPYETVVFPLLLPRGEGGYSKYQQRQSCRPSSTVFKFYKRLIYQRYKSFSLLPRVSEQLFLDAFSRAHAIRFEQTVTNANVIAAYQSRILDRDVARSTLQTARTSTRGTATIDYSGIGKRWTLPASIHGSPQYQRQRIWDGMSVISDGGDPTFFLTATTSIKWHELGQQCFAAFCNNDSAMHVPTLHDNPRLHPALTVRAFRLRLKLLQRWIEKGNIWPERHVAYLQRSIEFQRSGLSHAHILLRFSGEPLLNGSDVDAYVSARRFMPELCHNQCHQLAECQRTCSTTCFAQRVAALVEEFMIHECNARHCKGNGIDPTTCSKGFPAPVASRTTMTERGRWQYRRSEDDRFVVTYNPLILFLFQSHANLECCTGPGAAIYIRKYISKMPDAVRFRLETRQGAPSAAATSVPLAKRALRQELLEWQRARYCSSSEAVTHLLAINTNYMSPSCTTLMIQPPSASIRVPNSTVAALEAALLSEKPSTLQRYFGRHDALAHLRIKEYFSEWSLRNTLPKRAQTTVYPDKFVHPHQQFAVERTKRTVCRFQHIHLCQKTQEVFCLMLLLNEVPATSFVELRTVADVTHPTFSAAAQARGVFDTDEEYKQCLQSAINSHLSRRLWEAAHEDGTVVVQSCCTHDQCLNLFITIVLGAAGNAAAPHLFEQFWPYMLREKRTVNLLTDVASVHLDRARCLLKVSSALGEHGFSLSDVGFTVDDERLVKSMEQRRDAPASGETDQVQMERNRFIRHHDTNLHKDINLNTGQQFVYDRIFRCVTDTERQQPKYFFVTGDAGTGKTTLVKKLCAVLRLDNRIVLHSAFIANTAQLLPGGETTHRVCGLPVCSDATAMSNGSSSLTRRQKRGVILQHADVLIIDEITMLHKEYLRMIHDVLTELSAKPIVLLLGDFKQLAPVMDKESSSSSVSNSVVFSSLWDEVEKHCLTQQCRITDSEYLSFANSIGTGGVDKNDGPHLIPFPRWLRHTTNVADFYNQLYERRDFANPTLMSKKVILAYTHRVCDEHNKHVAETAQHAVSRPWVTLTGINCFCPTPGTRASANPSRGGNFHNITTGQLLNDVHISSIPPTRLDIFRGCVVTILRNINPSLGLVNGARCIFLEVRSNRVVSLHILSTSKTELVPRIIFEEQAMGTVPFQRKQFPIKIAYAITVNRSQGTTIDGNVGFDTRGSAFAHGHPYVAMSRVHCRQQMLVLHDMQDEQHFVNVVSQRLLTASASPHDDEQEQSEFWDVPRDEEENDQDNHDQIVDMCFDVYGDDAAGNLPPEEEGNE